MSARFGEAALPLCSAAARLLGWRPDDFWSATPAELATCLAPTSAADTPLARSELERLMESDPDGHG